jgi:hypothetical protein
MFLLAAAALPARLSETSGETSNETSRSRAMPLRYDPQFILETVAGRMGVTLQPETPPPAVLLESRTPLQRLQAAAERQGGFRPHVFVTTYASAANEIYLIDDAGLYTHFGGTPDDSLAHELVHYIQANYLKDPFTTDWSESEAVAIQTWFREQFAARTFPAGGAQLAGSPRKKSKAAKLAPPRSLRHAFAHARPFGVPRPSRRKQSPAIAGRLNPQAHARGRTRAFRGVPQHRA